MGIGEADPEVNPFARAWARAQIPTLHRLTGGSIPTLTSPRILRSAASTFPLVATLGIEGTPQSGTGQTALLTGVNAAKRFGRHFGPWIPVALRPLVEQRSLMRRALDAGRSVAFANAYPRGWPGKGGGRRLAGPPLAARGAGVLDRHEEALAAGTAVASEIVNDGWRERLGHVGLPVVTPAQAGANLARVAAHRDLTLFAHYATDTAGHSRTMHAAVAALRRVDAFLGGLTAELAPDTLVLVASDHGNIEDVRTGHTRNPALGLASGPGSRAAADLSDIRDVAAFVLQALGVSG